MTRHLTCTLFIESRLATVWVNLPQISSRINDRLSVHFFSVAFLAFMSVATCPSYLEERSVFVREKRNGLYGPGAYVLAQVCFDSEVKHMWSLEWCSLNFIFFFPCSTSDLGDSSLPLHVRSSFLGNLLLVNWFTSWS